LIQYTKAAASPKKEKKVKLKREESTEAQSPSKVPEEPKEIKVKR